MFITLVLLLLVSVVVLVVVELVAVVLTFGPCMLIVLSLLFVQLMHTNYYKIVKQLKSFRIIIVAPTCFGLHKPSSGSSLPVLR